jgi:hypothetical protein
MLIQGDVNQMCGETPIDLRMGVLAPEPTLLGLAELSLRRSVRLRLTLPTNFDKTDVDLKLGWGCGHHVLS